MMESEYPNKGFDEIPDDTGIVSGVHFPTLEKEPEGIENFTVDVEEKRSLAQDPRLKVGLASVVAVLFLFFGYQSTKNKSDVAEESAGGQLAEEETEELTLELGNDRFAKEENELEVARSELALLQQQMEMAAINRSELNRQATARANQAQRDGSVSQEEPRTQRVERVRPLPPPPVAATPPRPVTSRPSSFPARAPGAQNLNAPRVEVDPVDPVALWNNQSRLGVIGSLASPYSADDEQVALGSEANAGNLPRSQASLSAVQYVGSSNNIPGIRSSSRRSGVIPLGQRFNGEVAVAIPWIDTAERDDQSYVIEVKEPLLDRDGRVAIPEDAQIIVQTSTINRNNGYGELLVVGYMVDNEIYALPDGVISVNGEDGELLIAERYRDGGGAGELAGLFGLGVLSGVGDALDGDSTTIDIFSTGTTVSSSSGDGDVFGSALGGGADAVLEQYERRAEQRFEDREKRETIFYLEEGTEVEFYVSKEFAL